jgi:putative DNA primase/helicase
MSANKSIAYPPGVRYSVNGHDPPKIPKPVTGYDQWVCYRRKQRSDGNTDKIPTDPNISGPLGNVSKTDPANWLPYQQTHAYATTKAHLDGVGFVLDDNDPFTVIDLDGCRNPEIDKIDEWAWQIIKAFNSYTEISPSGMGVHIWVYGTVRGTTRPELNGHRIEAYSEKRFVTVTGDRVDGTLDEIVDKQNLLDELSPAVTETDDAAVEATHIGLSDAEVIDKARAADNSEKFCRLFDKGDISDYGDDSADDMALAGILVFYTGSDVDQAARLMCQSKLYRDKYERPDYLPRTITKALKGQTGFYGLSENANVVEILSDETPTSGIRVPSERKLIFQTAKAIAESTPDKPRWVAKPWSARGNITEIVGPAKGR